VNGAALTIGLTGLVIAGWWVGRRVVINIELRHLEDSMKQWGGVDNTAVTSDAATGSFRPSERQWPRAATRSDWPGAGELVRRPATIREWCDADLRRKREWERWESTLDDIRDLPETQVEEWLI
jgi:hypothetical protein